MKYLKLFTCGLFAAIAFNILYTHIQRIKFNRALQELEETSKRTQELTCEVQQEIDECWVLIEEYKKGKLFILNSGLFKYGDEGGGTMPSPSFVF